MMRKVSTAIVTSAVVGAQTRSCANAGGEQGEVAPTTATTVLSHCAGLYRSKLVTGEVLPYPCPALAEEQVSNVNDVLEALQPGELTDAKLAEKAANRKKLADEAETHKNSGNSSSGVGTHSLNKEVAEAGLSGAFVPDDIGGLDLGHRSLALVLENLSAVHAGGSKGSAQFVQQYVHQAGAVSHLLKTSATKEQQGRLFSQILDGEMVIAWAPEEEASGNDVSAVKTVAKVNAADSTYIVDGVKTPVFGASNATHFIILAKTQTQQLSASNASGGSPVAVERLSFFLVDKSSPGVEVISSASSSNISDVGTVKFTGVKVPSDNVIGTAGQAFSTYQVSRHHTNFTHASVILGMLKQALDLGAQALGGNASSEKKEGEAAAAASISSTAAQHSQAGKAWLELASMTYALESNLYLLTGNLDRNTEDSLIESALMCAMAGDFSLKTAEMLEGHFSSYVSHQSTSAAAADGDLLATSLSQLATSLRLHSFVVNETDSLRQLASCCGVEDFGVWFRGTSSLMMIQIRSLRSLGQKDKFGGFAAQALQKEAERLEKAVLSFGAAVEYIYVKQGLGVYIEGLKMERVAEACSHLYMAAATLSRAEMCIKESGKKKGNPSCGETKAREVELASVFVNEALRTVELLSEKVVKSAASVESSYGRVTADLMDKYLS